jgi:hypothetical protein
MSEGMRFSEIEIDRYHVNPKPPVRIQPTSNTIATVKYFKQEGVTYLEKVKK